ncbi:MAG: hypothetical protein B6I18_05250 [Bacteroidetes bacterium 4572_112]|nr:MAG: hypothetical protein B6I18_05250 [Bacteroidetes bacterium 4572_112]
MKISRIIFFIFLAISSISCSTIFHTTETNTIDIDEKGIQHTPLITDLEIRSKKVEGKAFGSVSAITKLKEEAIFNAVSKSNADLLIEPIYTITTSGSKATVTVVGWPANYRNFKQMTVADTTVLIMAVDELSKAPKSVDEQAIAVEKDNKAKKQKKMARVLVVYLGIMAVGLVILAIVL